MKQFTLRKGMHHGKGLAPCRGLALMLVLAMGPATAWAAIMTGAGPVTGIALSGLAGRQGFFRIGPALPVHAPAQGTGSTQGPRRSKQGSHTATGSSSAKGYTGGLPIFHDDYCEQYGC